MLIKPYTWAMYNVHHTWRCTNLVHRMQDPSHRKLWTSNVSAYTFCHGEPILIRLAICRQAWESDVQQHTLCLSSYQQMYICGSVYFAYFVAMCMDFSEISLISINLVAQKETTISEIVKLWLIFNWMLQLSSRQWGKCEHRGWWRLLVSSTKECFWLPY